MFKNVYLPGQVAPTTVDEDRGVQLEGLGSLGRDWSGFAARLTWGDHDIRFEFDIRDDVDEAAGRKYNYHFFLREGVGEQFLVHADLSDWPWYVTTLSTEEREQARLLAIEALLMRRTSLIKNDPLWLGVVRFRSGGREFTLEDFGYDAAMIQKANMR